MEVSEILLNLGSKSTIKVRKAAKQLRRHPIEGVCTNLLESYKRELRRNSWETQKELIVTAGIIGCRDFIPYLEKICKDNESYNTVTSNAACSYLRLARHSLSDISHIVRYSDNMGYSLGKGFLFALGLDRMMPSIEEQEMLISKFYNFGLDRDRTCSDPRYGIAAACAGWTNSKVDDFLHHCIKTGDKYLIHVAESALKGEYVKKHIYGIY